MSLIDWPSLVRNALWILGLSIVLAAWSYASWVAAQRRVRAWRAIEWPFFVVPVSGGLMLFAAGMTWGATRIWERVLWIALALAFLAQMTQGWREARHGGWLPQPAAACDSIASGSAADDSVRHETDL
jgi:hypothetical protein